MYKGSPPINNFGTLSYANECIKSVPLTVFTQRHFVVDFTYIYTSLFTKMVVKRRRKKYIHTKIQQTTTEAKIKNKQVNIQVKCIFQWKLAVLRF